jgi:hypothetical protein
MDEQKKSRFIIGAFVLAALGFLVYHRLHLAMNDPFPPKFEDLPYEEKIEVRRHLIMAHTMYAEGRNEQCLQEIKKVHAKIQPTLDSKDLEVLCKH